MPVMRLAAPVPVLVLLALAACGGGDDGTPSSTLPAGDGPLATFSMQSSAFANEGDIPERFTCDGANVSPPLFWGEPPERTQAFVLIKDDPGAPDGAFNHWVYYDIPGAARSLPEAVPTISEPPSSGAQGVNSFGETGYSGPCPPPGEEHGYVFTLTALDGEIDLQPGASKEAVLQAVQGRALGEARLTGRYGR